MPRPKKPTAIKVLKGTFRPCREVDQEPEIPRKAKYDPPPDFDGLALKTWLETEPVLTELGVLTDADLLALEMYCIHYANFLQAQEEVERNGYVVSGANGGMVKNPACTVVKESSAEMRALSGVLGLDPAARSRINVRTKKSARHSFSSIRESSARRNRT